MKYLVGIIIIVVIAGAVAFMFLGGMPSQKTGGAASQSTSTQQTSPAQTGVKKQGTTSKTGTITQAGNSFFITVAGSTPELIDSYSVDLAQYVGETVTISGQYSGDTLFVGAVE